MKTPNPKFIDPKDIREGMKLKAWYKTDYEPKQGDYSPCDGYFSIRRVDKDFVYYSYDSSGVVKIAMIGSFNAYTIIEEVKESKIEKYTKDNPPKHGAEYWYIDICGDVDVLDYNMGNDGDKCMLHIGNCFVNKESAELELAEIMKE